MNAKTLVERCKSGGLKIATAESCTGGLISGAITAVPGSSAVLGFGFVTYSNAAKTDLLGVPAELLAVHGAVSEEVAGAMAKGALTRAKTDLAVGVTGIAGPDGGSKEKPVGTVCFGLAQSEAVATYRKHFPGTRDEVRQASVDFALKLLLEAAEGSVT